MATAIQYGLIAALIGGGLIAGVIAVGNALEDTFEMPAYERTDAPTAMPPRLSYASEASSPVLVMTPNGPIVECPAGYGFVPRARPSDAPQAMSCELPS